MYLFDIILKLIATLHLIPDEKRRQLHVEVEAWTDSATEDSPDKMKAFYAKIHKGVLFKLITPFLYFFLLNWVKNMTAPPEDDFLRDD